MPEQEATSINLTTPDSESLQPDVIEAVLGSEVIVDIESLSQEIEQFAYLANQSNPFSWREVGKPAAPDFSFLKTRQINRIESLGIPPNSEITRRLAQKTPQFRKSARHHELTELARESYIHCRDKVEDINKNLDVYALNSVQSSVTWAELSERQSELAKIAAGLPNRATLETIISIYDVAKEFLLEGSSRFINAPKGKVIKDVLRTSFMTLMSLDEKETKEVKALIKQRGVVAEKGFTAYEVVRQAVNEELAQLYLRLLDVLTRAKLSLSAQGEDVEPAVLPVERYLLGKVTVLTEELKKIDPEALKNADTKKKLNTLQRISPSPAEKAISEKAKLFDSRITQARNVLKGGGKLDAQVKDKANQLHGLRLEDTERTHLLEPEQRGLIVAIITDKLEQVLETVQFVQFHQDGELVDFMKLGRPEDLRSIERFDIARHLGKLEQVLDDFDGRQMLASILSADELAKVETNVKKILELVRAQNPSLMQNTG